MRPFPRIIFRHAFIVRTRRGISIGPLQSLIALCALTLLTSGCSGPAEPRERVFAVAGVVKEIKQPDRLVIQHEEIPGYMAAMTMPFRVQQTNDLAGVRPGDAVQFQFHVTEEESWITQVKVRSPGQGGSTLTNDTVAPVTSPASAVVSVEATNRSSHPLMTYKFTNQLGQAVSLSDFRGSALAITFIFTRCPVPDYCPRLTRNFQEAAQKLSALPNAPTNWHLLSFTIDPGFDTPRVLKAYAERYKYDPVHWSFLTGSSERVADLVRESGVTVEPSGSLFSHNFRTLIVGTNGQLLASIPIGGPISDGIVAELMKALGR